ncbi:metallophosphoesterase [Williamsia sterculiae]|uniref:3',5'-cyclic AMP phosphodiesterase CpdA n=1 Tax=Williamsia sterculiae TaxID=1344003 RepID=A0A1N7HCF5_9NOCA|nr:metallophosphoesterase [Williamsia sterculiae]SIS22557.1 3',5'-cyclic AMP phosphodiesterase CpdA [Williamsia sterculiae]
MLVVAHISDLHFDGSKDHRARAQAVMDYLNDRADGIDALVVTGDIADAGTPSQYMEAAAVLQTPIPMLIAPGNHDNRENFSRDLLGVHPTAGPINFAQTVGGALILSCDSSIPGRPEGYLADETIEWMDAEITAAGDVPVIVAVHHPPVTLDMPFMDSIRMQGVERLGALIVKHSNIITFLCGHAHTGAVTRYYRRRVCIAPGVASTLNLPFENDGIINESQPAGLALHVIDHRWRVITHFRAVEVRGRRKR